MLRSFVAIILLCSFCACQSRSKEQFTKYYEDGRAKPTVAIVPVMDSTSFDFPWSLSEEFTDLVVTKASQKGSLFIPNDKESSSPISYSQDLFSLDLSWMKQAFSQNEFVVFVELLEHNKSTVFKKNIPFSELPSNLDISLRVRVVDLRREKPEIILQEKISDSYYISKNYLPVDYNQTCWGSDDYKTTAFAITHSEIAKQLIERINDYIMLAKSR